MSGRERRVDLSDGAALRVVERGGGSSGSPLLMLHGFTGSAEAWGEALLDRLAEDSGRRVLAVDLPGHGESDAPRDPARYRMERVLEDLEGVLDAVEAGRAVWIGYSMGGRVALGAAVLRPGRVEALVLESASPGLHDAGERRARRMADEALARRIECGGAEGMEGFVDEWMDLPLFASQQRLPGEVLEAVRARRLASDPVGLAASLRGLGTGRQPSFWGRLDEVDRPVLLLTGALDAKFEGIAGRMVERFGRRGSRGPGEVRWRSVDGAGHTVHLERPDAWLEAVLEFLSGSAVPN